MKRWFIHILVATFIFTGMPRSAQAQGAGEELARLRAKSAGTGLRSLRGGRCVTTCVPLGDGKQQCTKRCGPGALTPLESAGVQAASGGGGGEAAGAILGILLIVLVVVVVVAVAGADDSSTTTKKKIAF